MKGGESGADSSTNQVFVFWVCSFNALLNYLLISYYLIPFRNVWYLAESRSCDFSDACQMHDVDSYGLIQKYAGFCIIILDYLVYL